MLFSGSAFSAFASGLGLGLSLIVAIGAQNAFVLKQGLKGEHVFAVCLVCAVSDALLISAGVSGFTFMTEKAPWLEPLLRYGGAAFLFVYAGLSLRSAFKSSAFLVASAQQSQAALGKILLICLAFTWLNPHVYLDTVVFMGMFSASFPENQLYFALGAICASFTFFFSLGYGAAYLRPFLMKARFWRIFEAFIAFFMFALAIKLLIK